MSARSNLPTAATLSAARMPGSSWARRSRPGAAVAGETRRGRARRLSANLIVQLGLATEELNRRWYEANTGEVITDVQKRVRHPGFAGWPPPSMGVSRVAGRCSKPSSCCRGRSPEEGAAEVHAAAAAQYGGHDAKLSVLSIITGGGKWVESESRRIRSTSTSY